MLPKNRLGAAPRNYFRTELTHCPHCETNLQRSYTAWHKKISTLNGVIETWSMAYACKNPACPHTGVSYKSTEAEMLNMKHSSKGYDVLALVGELRFKQHMTVKELANALNEGGIQTRERHAQNLYEWYQVLLAASLYDHVRLRCWLKRQSKTAVSLYPWMAFSRRRQRNPVCPARSISGTALAAKNMKSGAAAKLQTLILPVIELDFPIVGIVSDGQHSIRLAVDGLLPGVPYLNCQYHFLKDFAKSLVDPDRKLKTELKKSMLATIHCVMSATSCLSENKVK